MVVICPKCKTKLKVADEKIAPEGTKFKCPKCATVLFVRGMPQGAKTKEIDRNKVLIAHEDMSVTERMRSVLSIAGFNVVVANDGIEAMVKAVKELPSFAVLGVATPKIYGFEVCKKLKERADTKDIKVILVASINREDRYRREPLTFHGADEYIEPQQIEDILIKKIDVLRGVAEKEQGKELEEKPEIKEGIKREETVEKQTATAVQKEPSATDILVEKAKRLARTIISDIYLYSKAKVDDAIMKNAFHSTFEAELKEGYKLYLNRVSTEVRESGDYFNEAINNFIEQRREELSK